MLIPLSQGLVAEIDDEDYERVSMLQWHACQNRQGASWYARASLRQWNITHTLVHIWMHQWVMFDFTNLYDHEDRNGLNNKKGNLRFATRRENQGNRRARLNGSSQYKGVTLHPSGGWMARVAGRYLGIFRTEEEAALAYNEGATVAFGTFARLNVLPDIQPTETQLSELL